LGFFVFLDFDTVGALGFFVFFLDTFLFDGAFDTLGALVFFVFFFFDFLEVDGFCFWLGLVDGF
jgi:hypothetical protein